MGADFCYAFTGLVEDGHDAAVALSAIAYRKILAKNPTQPATIPSAQLPQHIEIARCWERTKGVTSQGSRAARIIRKTEETFKRIWLDGGRSLSVAERPGFSILLFAGEIEHYIVSNVKKAIPQSVKDRYNEYRAALKKEEKETFGNDNISEHVEMAGWGVEEAEARNQAEASLGTQLALAYAIHKSFIFVRVPLTAAILPKVVKVLRSWGWKIGKKKSKA
ncbi:peptide alpha-N-acetyltransferase Nat2 [Seiridium cupressi]